jgi:hypothetical protein
LLFNFFYIKNEQVRSGGTLVNCGKALLEAGAKVVSVFCAHAAFEAGVPEAFVLPGGKFHGIFDRVIIAFLLERDLGRHVAQKTHNSLLQFYVTNSVPYVTDMLPAGDFFRVLDLTSQLAADL